MNPDTSIQKAIKGPLRGHHTVFIEGPVGAGKSRALVERLHHLLASGTPGYSVLVLLPDRTAVARYLDLLSSLDIGSHDAVDLHTYYSLATRLVRLFWPIVAADAGFASPQRPPVHLNYEAAQYLMGQLIGPLLEHGYFEGLSVRTQRIISQLIDNMNKAGLNGYSIEEVEPKLRRAWVGETDRLRYYAQAQECIKRFRQHCLKHSLLDISLTLEVFHRYLFQEPLFRRYFTERYRHLLVDNLEETVPVAQDLIRHLLSTCDSAMLAYDQGGGHRVVLGVDAERASELRGVCREIVFQERSTTSSADMSALASSIGRRLGRRRPEPSDGDSRRAVLEIIRTRYRSDMLQAVVRKILDLTHQDVSPGEIAIVAPYADGVLRFALSEGLREADIPFRVMRRSEDLREEPVIRACLTFAALAHPEWGLPPHPFDVAETLSRTISILDPVRAALLTQWLYDQASSVLNRGENLEADKHDRVGSSALEHYDALRGWIDGYREGTSIPLDHFLRRLFGEVLSGPDLPYEDAAACAKLIASAEGFRRSAPSMGLDLDSPGSSYLRMIHGGVIAAQYTTAPEVTDRPDAVALVAPIYTYLLSDQAARFQFWLDAGSIAWWEPPHQPLTNPYVLARRWPKDAKWTDAADLKTRNEALARLVGGLAQRCREGVYICTSELQMTGEPQNSPLFRAIQDIWESTA